MISEQKFSENLMRAVVAELHVLNLQTASREMFGRGYFSLGIGDKMAVEQVVLAAIIAAAALLGLAFTFGSWPAAAQEWTPRQRTERKLLLFVGRNFATILLPN